MFDSEDHRLWQVNLIALLVNGCGDDRGVDDNRVIRIDGIAAQSDAGVLRGEVGAQVLVHDKHHPDLTCTKGTRIVHSIIVVKQWWQKFDTSSGWEKKIERHRETEITVRASARRKTCDFSATISAMLFQSAGWQLDGVSVLFRLRECQVCEVPIRAQPGYFQHWNTYTQAHMHTKHARPNGKL